MDAYLEFLSENAQRRYPFQEDSSLLNNTGDTVLADNVILDLRGIHRERPEVSPQLLAVIGSDGASIFDLDALAGFYSFFFAMGRSAESLIFQVAVPSDNTQWPFVQEVTIADENYPGRDVRLGTLRVTLGEGVADLASDVSLGFVQTCLIETALVAQAYRTQVDSIKVAHVSGPDDIVGGDLRIIGGYGINTQLLVDGLEINAIAGAGSLGFFTGAVHEPEDSACSGRVLSISGQRPNPRGKFYIRGENGISVTDLPDEHKIQLRVTTASLGGNRCD